MKIVTAHWLDHIHLWLFFATFLSIFVLCLVILPLRERWLAESRQWPMDRMPSYFGFDELSHNKTGEGFNRWLVRDGHRRVRLSLRLVFILTVFCSIWPLISKDYCSVNKCGGRAAPAAASAR